ncbi:MAG: 2'-5' RNA ligase family protein [Candidatus Dojkabacteria bacterium]|jgi:2'-5' RNA ligase|nr:2'-5' RNA ligase family protein [Candidatus Dojkabacteria bacterium]
MSYFLGFIPEKESKYKIGKVIGEVGMMFDDFGIPVRWVKPKTYHISLYYLGERFSFLNKFLLGRKMKKVHIPKINISFATVKVGISRNYKELVYLELKDGGEELRELLLQLRNNLGGKDTSMFVPHLTIGRISKDLSQEEYRNVAKDIARVSRKLQLEDIEFTVDTIYLIESKDGDYSFKMKFDAS